MPSEKLFDSEFVKRIGKQMMEKESIPLRFTTNRTDEQIKDDFKHASSSLRSAKDAGRS